MDGYVTLEEMARELGLKDASALRHAYRRGTLRAERVGNRTLVVALSEVERYARGHLGRRGRRAAAGDPPPARPPAR